MDVTTNQMSTNIEWDLSSAHINQGLRINKPTNLPTNFTKIFIQNKCIEIIHLINDPIKLSFIDHMLLIAHTVDLFIRGVIHCLVAKLQIVAYSALTLVSLPTLFTKDHQNIFKDSFEKLVYSIIAFIDPITIPHQIMINTLVDDTVENRYLV